MFNKKKHIPIVEPENTHNKLVRDYITKRNLLSMEVLGHIRCWGVLFPIKDRVILADVIMDENVASGYCCCCGDELKTGTTVELQLITNYEGGFIGNGRVSLYCCANRDECIARLVSSEREETLRRKKEREEADKLEEFRMQRVLDEIKLATYSP
jgi:hypothetical protein